MDSASLWIPATRPPESGTSAVVSVQPTSGIRYILLAVYLSRAQGWIDTERGQPIPAGQVRFYLPIPPLPDGE